MSWPRLPLLCALLLAAAVACEEKPSGPPPLAPLGNVHGHGAIPDDARVVMGVELAAFSRSDFLLRMVDRWLGAPGRERMMDLLTRAGVVVPRDVRRVTLALGESPDQMLLVVESDIDEQRFAKAVAALVKKNGGVLRHTQWRGKNIYQARAGAYGLPLPPPITWFAFSAPDTLIVSVGEGWLRHARDPQRTKFDRTAIPDKIDRERALWFVSSLAGSTGDALRDLTGDALTGPVQAMSGSLRLGDDAALVGAVVFQLGSDKDAEAFALFSKQQLPELNAVAQAMGVRAMLHKIDVAATGQLVRASVTLQREELATLETGMFPPAEGKKDE